MNLRDTLIRYLLPVMIGLLTAVLSPALLTSKRLRDELAADVQMLEKLPPGARAELRREVQRRTLLLVSLTKYPALNRFDVLAVVGLIAVVAFGVLTSIDVSKHGVMDAGTTLMTPGVMLLSGISCWSAFHVRWCNRAARRLEYVEARLGPEESADLQRVLKVAWTTSLLVGVAAVAGPVAGYLVVLFSFYEWNTLLAAALAAATVMLIFALMYRVDDKSSLGRELVVRTDEFKLALNAQAAHAAAGKLRKRRR